MCQHSVNLKNTRDAEHGEKLVVSRAVHDASNWLTQPGNPSCAVCIPDTAVLAVQMPDQAVRGATFAQRQEFNSRSEYDFLNFLDGEKESMPLNQLPIGTGVQVLSLFGGINRPIPAIPATISTTQHIGTKPSIPVEALVPVLAIPRTGGSGRQGGDPVGNRRHSSVGQRLRSTIRVPRFEKRDT